MRTHNYEYDAFISHAVEDKIPIANELCARLEQAGLRVWYSGKELGIGDSIEKTIERGLNRSRYGIVVLSPTYLAKNWTIREFYTLLAKEIEDRKVILPVLYNVTPDDLKERDLHMADRFAVNADLGLEYVVDRLVREIRKPELRKPRKAWLSGVWAMLACSLVVNLLFLARDMGFRPQSYPSQITPAGFVFTGDQSQAHPSTDTPITIVLQVSPAEAARLYREILGDVARGAASSDAGGSWNEMALGTYPVN
jgi:hypothetical protein